MQAEQPADAEHADKAEQDRGRRNAAQVEAPEVDDVQEAAKEVVEYECQQQEAATQEQAAAEYQIRCAHALPSSESTGR